MFDRVAIIGLGLIGSSLAYDIRQHGLADHIVGFDNNPLAGEALGAKKAIDAFHTLLAEVAAPVDLVIIATPPKFFDEVARKLSPLLKAGTLVMDTGSIKASVIAALSPHLPPSASFIPAHPITGGERSGAGTGEKDLFKNRRVILTPEADVLPAELDLARRFWEALGSVCEVMSAEKHDLIYAHMSHVPHLAAFAASFTLAAYLDRLPEALTPFLRIGGSSPELWCDIALANQPRISEALEVYLTVLNHVIAELKAGESLGEASAGDTREIAGILFPRIAASCLVSAVTRCEKREGTALARYAGPGFADFTSPLQTPPEGDIERISLAYRETAAVLTDFESRLRAMAVTLKERRHETLLAQMQEARSAWQRLTAS